MENCCATFGACVASQSCSRVSAAAITGAMGAVKKNMDGSDPLIVADVSYSPKFIYDAIKMTATARLKGEALPAKTIIPSVLITRDNAKQFYFADSPY